MENAGSYEIPFRTYEKKMHIFIKARYSKVTLKIIYFGSSSFIARSKQNIIIKLIIETIHKDYCVMCY